VEIASEEIRSRHEESRGEPLSFLLNAAASGSGFVAMQYQVG
jgi:hypothetical protein